jgi:hypothetical protein
MNEDFLKVELFLNELCKSFKLLKAKKINNSYSLSFVVETKDLLAWHNYFACLCQHDLTWQVCRNRLTDVCQVIKIEGLKI